MGGETFCVVLAGGVTCQRVADSFFPSLRPFFSPHERLQPLTRLLPLHPSSPGLEPGAAPVQNALLTRPPKPQCCRIIYRSSFKAFPALKKMLQHPRIPVSSARSKSAPLSFLSISTTEVRTPGEGEGAKSRQLDVGRVDVEELYDKVDITISTVPRHRADKTYIVRDPAREVSSDKEVHRLAGETREVSCEHGRGKERHVLET